MAFVEALVAGHRPARPCSRTTRLWLTFIPAARNPAVRLKAPGMVQGRHAVTSPASRETPSSISCGLSRLIDSRSWLNPSFPP